MGGKNIDGFVKSPSAAIMDFWGTHPGEANGPFYLLAVKGDLKKSPLAANALFSEQARLRRIKKFIQRSEKGLCKGLNR